MILPHLKKYEREYAKISKQCWFQLLPIQKIPEIFTATTEEYDLCIEKWQKDMME